MSKRQTVLVAVGLSLLYFGIQLAYLSRLPLVMDEFDGANEAYQLLDLTPYKDFRPYKTVLGYYLQLPPLLFTTDPWTGLMLSKAWLAGINAIAILAATLVLARIYSPGAALVGQLLLICMTTFLERSSEIRVDMLTAWVGLASLLFLLRRQWVAAGIVLGLSFLVSQKAAYYILSTNAAAGAYWLFEQRDRRTFRDLIALNLSTLAVVGAYVALWGLVSTPWTVFSATFLSHGDIVFRELYTNLGIHWTRTLSRNPLFYGGAVAGMLLLVVAWRRGQATGIHGMTAAYGAVLFALCAWHKQPWPYFFVILIPTLMVVHVAAAELVLRDQRLRTLATVLILAFGVVWPATYMPGMLARNHKYQRHVIRLAGAMLGENDTYLAGNDLVYDRRQANAALRRLSEPRIEAMRGWPPERFSALIAELEVSRPKLVFDDIRMRMLPEPLRAYLSTRFDRLWSSIESYAPVIQRGDSAFELWFDGEYQVEPESGGAVIDGRTVPTGTVLTLERGPHRNGSATPVRLRLLPPGWPAHADPQMERRQQMFNRAYDY